MTLHVCVLGIDGSGKSTITAALAPLVSAESELVCASIGDRFTVAAPDEDLVAEKFYPDGLPLAARLSLWFKKAAKRRASSRTLYPILKVVQMMLQDRATLRISKRYKTDISFSDGNLVLSAIGRAGNYLRPASDSSKQESPSANDLAAVFSHIFHGTPVPPESKKRLPPVRIARLFYKLTNWPGLRIVWLPDVIIFLDLSPQKAMSRIAFRKQKIDRHENEADLTQAREMYQKALSALHEYRVSPIHVLQVDDITPGESLRSIVEFVKSQVEARSKELRSERVPLGTTTTKLSGQSFFAKIFNYKYVVRYLIGKFFHSAWREPFFVLSSTGRLFLKEGYSAGVMRVIYDRDSVAYGPMDRIFLNYPLHRAVYDRLQILTRKIEDHLFQFLNQRSSVTIFTAPSGFAYDLFRPIEAIAKNHPALVSRLTLVAADLDPHRVLEKELSARASRINGLRFTFRRGDLTNDEMRRSLETWGLFDMALFVGLSAWLPKQPLLRHLEWVHENLKPDGLLITDSFTAEPYAYSGKYIGYKANYYSPDVYRCIVDYCGFDGIGADVESGRDAINHVLIASTRKK